MDDAGGRVHGQGRAYHRAISGDCQRDPITSGSMGSDATNNASVTVDTHQGRGELMMCEWFALCDRVADGTSIGPIGDGMWGAIPICNRCARVLDLDIDLG